MFRLVALLAKHLKLPSKFIPKIIVAEVVNLKINPRLAPLAHRASRPNRLETL
jgi:hypothetical protein